MITPTASATLRTSQIMVVILIDTGLQPDSVELIQTLGAFLIVIATLSVIFDYETEKMMSKLCHCASSRNDEDRFDQLGRRRGSSWLDSPLSNIITDNGEISNRESPRNRHSGRLRVVSISLS